MAGPKTVFDADECQALLDLIERLTHYPFLMIRSDEERAAFAKLIEAGKFYVPAEAGKPEYECAICRNDGLHCPTHGTEAIARVR